MPTYTFETHGMTVKFDDNSPEILEALANAVERALEGIGGEAVKHAQEEIRTPKPVFPGVVQDAIDTSELIQTIDYKVVDDDVYVGTNTKHAA